MGFDNLNEETRKKLYSCETPEELLETAAEYGVKLSEEELSMISGGTASFQSAKDKLFIILGGDDRAGARKSGQENLAYYIPD